MVKSVFISYRKLNQIIFWFKYPFCKCNDVVINIGKITYHIYFNIYSGKWQIPVNLVSQPNIALFVINKKLHRQNKSHGIH